MSHLGVAEWNEKYPIGTEVRYRVGYGPYEEGVTNSAAFYTGKGDQVVGVQPKSGTSFCIMLKYVDALKEVLN